MKSLNFMFRIRTVERFLEFYFDKLNNDKEPEHIEIKKSKHNRINYCMNKRFYY